ncbi:MAG: DUF4294 domain-containing protein [Dysgonamonadaceae bacterium]|jgi:hypothetical protein|nr:DUF4294 domain-containing protein [Dysgonamonadaceae bacterium]
MKKAALHLIGILIFASFGKINAQTDAFRESIPPFLVESGDTIKTVALRDIFIYPPESFKYSDDEKKYQKLVRDVKKTLPYAKMIYGTLMETYEYVQTLPDDGTREKHLKRMEKELFNEYKPVLKKLTLSRGKLLIKLVDRECNQTSYDLLKAFLGPFRAGFWNIFAGAFGASLKTTWDPEGADAAAERVVELVEMGLL